MAKLKLVLLLPLVLLGNLAMFITMVTLGKHPIITEWEAVTDSYWARWGEYAQR